MSSARPRRAAPVSTTGGGGFAYEDRVGAWLVAAMLAGASPLGVEVGVPQAVEFQQKSPPTGLDDVVVRGDPGAGATTWWASIKSGRVDLGRFAGDAWAHALDAEFSFERDWLGLVTASLPDDEWASLGKLSREALVEDDPDRLAARIREPRVYNDVDRRVWGTFSCPGDLAAAHAVDAESSAALLLPRVLPRRLDLPDPHGHARAQARRWCGAALHPSDATRATDLHDAVLGFVARVRPDGGSISRQGLRAALGPRFLLATSPDADPDWRLLREHANGRLTSVRDQLAGGVRLPRAMARVELAREEDAAFAYLTGPSGCGKTALAKDWVRASTDGMWLEAHDLRDGLAALRQRLGLRLALPSALALGQRPVRIVIDGLDRSDEPGAVAATATLARLADGSGGLMQVLVTCQSGAHDRLVAANAPAGRVVVIGDLDEDDVGLLLARRPDLHRLAHQGALREVLRRPKLLDVALRSVSDDPAALPDLRDETAVADLWWARWALGGSSRRAARGELIMGLAVRAGDGPRGGVAAGQLGGEGLGQYADVADVLRADGVLGPDEDRYEFDHDLLGDWARYRWLTAQPDPRSAILERDARPLWHRAVRLVALRALRDGGVGAWRADHDALRAAGGDVAGDLFLDAPLFAADAQGHIEILWPALIADEGRLLRRMLARFVMQASVVDPRAALITDGGDAQTQALMATVWRVPDWVLWPPVLRGLATREEEAVAAAAGPVAAVAEMWLRSAPSGLAGRPEAAALGVAAGSWAAERTAAGHRLGEDLAKKIWKAFLAAGSERPGEVAALAHALLAAEDER